MVAAGGVGVLVVIAFVAGVALGGRTSDGGPGSRVAVGRTGDAGGLAVLVPRCRDERVTEVALADAGGRTLWRIGSRKGSIDERYLVGDDVVPLGFDVEVALRGDLPPAPLRASVAVAGEDGDVTDSMGFSLGSVPGPPAVLHRGEEVDVGRFQARALASAACPESRRDVSLTTIVFGLGALLVVGCYGLMVSRWWRGRVPR
jgi:hypothetical protein